MSATTPRPEIPQSPNAERALLAAMLQSTEVLDCYATFPEEAWHLPEHRMLFRTMRDMQTAGKPVDLVTVTETLIDAGTLEEIGGGAWLTVLWSEVATVGNHAYYAEIVREKATRRRIQACAHQLIEAVFADADSSADELLDNAEKKIMELRIDSTKDSHFVPLKNALAEAAEQVEHAYRNRGGTTGLPTGLVDLDRITGGLHGGQFVVIAARPSQGKTCLLMQIARNFSDSGPVAVFSLEMSARELGSRFLCNESRLDLARVRDGFLSKSDLSKMASKFHSLSRQPIFIDDTPALSILDFRSRARKAAVRHGIKAIFVDYLQLMQSPSKRAKENRALEVGEISRALKCIAKELDIPVIVAAQLNRDAEQRNSAPRLSDLRESGQIEQDADIVGMLHRPKKDAENQEDREFCQLIIAKQRNGPVGAVNLRFRGEYALFESVTEAMYSNNPNKQQKK